MNRSIHVVQLYLGKVGAPSNHAVVVGWSLGLHSKLSISNLECKFSKLFSECGFSATAPERLRQRSCSFHSQPGGLCNFLKDSIQYSFSPFY